MNLHGATAVLLPGTGSDDDYVHRVFSPTLHGLGVSVVTPPPRPDRLLDGYVDDLDEAARVVGQRVHTITSPSNGSYVSISWSTTARMAISSEASATRSSAS